MIGDVSINSLADEWNVSAQEAIKKLVDEGISTYCLLSADLTDAHSGEFAGKIRAECEVDHNRAEYADQRREMLQWWADFVEAQVEEPQKVIMGRFGGSIVK